MSVAGPVCEKCGARATHHICDMDHGATGGAREQHLCERCAEGEGFTPPTLAEALEEAEQVGDFPKEFHELLGFRFTHRAFLVLVHANRLAISQRHAPIAPLHLLLGVLLVKTAVGITALRRLGIDCAQLREVALRLLVDDAPKGNAKDVLNRARNESERLGRTHVGSEHILLALFDEPDDSFAGLLRRFAIKIEDVRRVVKETGDAN